MAESLTKIHKIGPLVRERRDELGMTQRQLGHKVGLQYGNFIGMLERGETKMPLDSWRIYAEALEVDEAEFCLLCMEEMFPDIVEMIPAMAKVIERKTHKAEEADAVNGDAVNGDADWFLQMSAAK
jgi:predicted transcriptional regulator